MNSWQAITRLGGIAVTAPFALAIAAVLLLEGERRLALWWSLLFSAGLAVVLASKIAFIGWGIGLFHLDYTGASGHATRAMAVAPVAAYLLLQPAGPTARATGVLCGVTIGILVGISRLELWTHSVSEVIAGWVIGGLVSAAFLGLAKGLQKQVFRFPRAAAILPLLLLLAFFGRALPTQEWLTIASLYISGHEQPFVRGTAMPAPSKVVGQGEG